MYMYIHLYVCIHTYMLIFIYIYAQCITSCSLTGAGKWAYDAVAAAADTVEASEMLPDICTYVSII